MNNRTIGTVLAVAIVVGGVGFWGGSTYSQSSRASRGGQFAAQFQSGGNRALRGGTGAAFGTIIAKDATSVTVQLGGPNATSTNGNASGTKIVLYNDSTE